MGEVICDSTQWSRRRLRAQTGAAIGPGAAALVYAGLYAVLPEEARVACLVRGRRPSRGPGFLGSPEDRRIRTPSRPSAGGRGAVRLFAAFRQPYLWTTVKVSLMVAGAQGGVFAVVQFWMPTYLRMVRGLSASTTGTYVFIQMVGALIGFLLGAYLSDAIGCKFTFYLSAIATAIMVLIFVFVPMGNTALLLTGIPAGASRILDEAFADVPVYDRSSTRPTHAAPARAFVTTAGGRSARSFRPWWGSRRHICRSDRRSRCSACCRAD